MRDEQLGYRPRHSTSLQPIRIDKSITSNFGEKRLTGAVFLDVNKAFHAVWIDGLFYKLTFLKFPSYIVHTTSSYIRGRTLEVSFVTATSSRRGTRAGVAQGGFISPALTLAPRRVVPIRGRHDHHSHVPPADVACHLTGVITQRWLSE